MTDAPGGGPLRVATFNVRAAIGPGPFPDRWWRHADPRRLARIARVIESLDADLVALQEVGLFATDGTVVDQAADLGRLTVKELQQIHGIPQNRREIHHSDIQKTRG